MMPRWLQNLYLSPSHFNTVVDVIFFLIPLYIIISELSLVWSCVGANVDTWVRSTR
ncbi:hypothetical protein BDV23DRAFT_55310 [Aspergillus alliaceus]|uniref:Uncharacterized protein n=1 Tax=Petromyces alliaceus TaxID=209559 RepID=A0A5N7CEU1_PETAA|nr:hypothetical protein BDV23DRAFT_55310 [Aspergillus alliaceus]